MNCFIVVILISCIPAILADQLPYPLQLFYLNPNNVGIIPPYHMASSYMAGRNTTGAVKPLNVHTKQTSAFEVIEGETSQFHSQDHRGRALFGYTTPDQARIESRSEDGTVRGSYSYLDAWGNAVKVQYWDDGTGFHAAGNNLPGVYSELPKPVQDTPEVTAAKEQHLQLLQQALAGAAASADKVNPISSFKPQQTNQQQEHEHQGIVVDSDYISTVADDDLRDLTRYPNLQMFPQNLFDPTHIHDANREAVIVDNPDISSDAADNNLRDAKTLQVKPLESPARVSDKVEQTHVPGGFFYRFSYPVPLYVQVRTVETDEKDNEKRTGTVATKDNLSVSQKAALFGAIPVAAVHDAQVPPHLKNSIKNFQVMPLYIETSGASK